MNSIAGNILKVDIGTYTIYLKLLMYFHLKTAWCLTDGLNISECTCVLVK